MALPFSDDSRRIRGRDHLSQCQKLVDRPLTAAHRKAAQSCRRQACSIDLTYRYGSCPVGSRSWRALVGCRAVSGALNNAFRSTVGGQLEAETRCWISRPEANRSACTIFPSAGTGRFEPPAHLVTHDVFGPTSAIRLGPERLARRREIGGATAQVGAAGRSAPRTHAGGARWTSGGLVSCGT